MLKKNIKNVVTDIAKTLDETKIRQEFKSVFKGIKDTFINFGGKINPMQLQKLFIKYGAYDKTVKRLTLYYY